MMITKTTQWPLQPRFSFCYVNISLQPSPPHGPVFGLPFISGFGNDYKALQMTEPSFLPKPLH